VSIIVKLDDMLHERRMTLTELSERIGITLANLSVLKTGKARAIRFTTLDAICAALRCQPGDLLEFCPAALADVDKTAAALGHEAEPLCEP
jgi:putative transcriptional regulator